jgi:hypothetical protein
MEPKRASIGWAFCVLMLTTVLAQTDWEDEDLGKNVMKSLMLATLSDPYYGGLNCMYVVTVTVNMDSTGFVPSLIVLTT